MPRISKVGWIAFSIGALVLPVIGLGLTALAVTTDSGSVALIGLYVLGPALAPVGAPLYLLIQGLGWWALPLPIIANGLLWLGVAELLQRQRAKSRKRFVVLRGLVFAWLALPMVAFLGWTVWGLLKQT